MPVGDGAHHTAHGEAVEVIVDEDQAAQHDGGQLSATRLLMFFLAQRPKAAEPPALFIRHTWCPG